MPERFGTSQKPFKKFDSLNQKPEKDVIRDMRKGKVVSESYMGGVLASVTYSSGETFYRNGDEFQTPRYMDVYRTSSPFIQQATASAL